MVDDYIIRSGGLEKFCGPAKKLAINMVMGYKKTEGLKDKYIKYLHNFYKFAYIFY